MQLVAHSEAYAIRQKVVGQWVVRNGGHQRIQPTLAQCLRVLGLERDLSRHLVAGNPHFIDIHTKCLGQANGLTVAVGKNFGGSV